MKSIKDIVNAIIMHVHHISFAFITMNSKFTYKIRIIRMYLYVFWFLNLVYRGGVRSKSAIDKS